MNTRGKVEGRLISEMIDRAKFLGFNTLLDCVLYLNDLHLEVCGSSTVVCEGRTPKTPGGPPARVASERHLYPDQVHQTLEKGHSLLHEIESHLVRSRLEELTAREEKVLRLRGTLPAEMVEPRWELLNPEWKCRIEE